MDQSLTDPEEIFDLKETSAIMKLNPRQLQNREPGFDPIYPVWEAQMASSAARDCRVPAQVPKTAEGEFMITEQCTKCGHAKPLNGFREWRRQCRDCEKAYQREYEKTAKCKADRRNYEHTQRYGTNRLRTLAKDATYNGIKAEKRRLREHPGEDLPTPTPIQYLFEL